MHFNRMSDQLFFMLQKNDINLRLSEVTNVSREVVELESYEDILHFGELNPIIEEFISKFKESFSEEQTKRMLHRLKTLTIKQQKGKVKKLSSKVSLGGYDNRDNSIVIYYYDDERIPINIRETLFHELLHMASTRNTEIGPITGVEIPDVLGENFNEGCTSYFTMKYFTKEDYKKSDDERIHIIKGIENLVGKEVLEDSYFDANIGTLIKALEEYSSREEIIKLFYLIDYIDDPFTGRKNYRTIIREIERMNKVRLNRKLQSGEISQKEYDIEYALKVNEYHSYSLWDEDVQVVEDGEFFLFIDKDRSSELYEFTKKSEKDKQFEKKYQE